MLLVFILTLSGLWLARIPLLKTFSNLWVVEHPLTESDAILVLGGGFITRTPHAAKLYREKIAPRILIFKSKIDVVEDSRELISEHEMIKKLLIADGVEESDIHFIETSVSSTFEEAAALSDWLQHHPLKQIVTDTFHTRRVSWIFGKNLSPSQAKILIAAAPDPNYTKDGWWQNENSVVFFFSEVCKTLYYWCKY